jgi:hypothetical protein
MPFRVFTVLLVASAVLAESNYNATEKIPFSYWSSAAYCSESQLQAWSCKACKLVRLISLQRSLDSVLFTPLSHLTSQTPHPTNVTVVQSIALDAYGFIAKQPDTSIIVAFRGSQNIRNWIANIDATKTAVDFPGCNGCEVHSGWYDAWSEVSAKVLAAVDAYGGKGAPAIHVTGHRWAPRCRPPI